MTNASVKEKSNGFKEASHKIFYDYFWLLNNHGNENKMEYYLIRIALVIRMIQISENNDTILIDIWKSRHSHRMMAGL